MVGSSEKLEMGYSENSESVIDCLWIFFLRSPVLLSSLIRCFGSLSRLIKRFDTRKSILGLYFH